MALEIKDRNFEELLASGKPLVVDFWATWCGPCKMLLPIVEQISTEVAATAKVGKVNVDDAQELARRYNVRNIPTLIFFKNGEEVDRITGMTSKDNILNRLRALM